MEISRCFRENEDFVLATDCIYFVCNSLGKWCDYKWLHSRRGKERVGVLFHGAVAAFFCGMRKTMQNLPRARNLQSYLLFVYGLEI
jgi:hypothetical protein